jgi:aspartyl-tRNA(Asn)/glutamyl-tRNA(Gln) amidotransferase subunit A
MQDYHYSSIKNAGELLKAQEISPVEIVKACLKRIELLNGRLNAFISVLGDAALEQAWSGIRATAAFERFKNRVPKKEAVSVRKLKEAGAIIIGKTNMHELAMGTTSVVSYFGPVHNPCVGSHNDPDETSHFFSE